MIRITSRNESGATRLVVEGKLAGRCVGELERCWQLASSNQTLIVVDLTSVSFIDQLGKELLTRMNRRGIRFVSSGLMSKCLIEEIEKVP